MSAAKRQTAEAHLDRSAADARRAEGLRTAPQQPEKRQRERREAVARNERLKAVLRAMRRVNHLITQEDDRQRLIQGSCDTLTEALGYHSAWIALFDDSRRRIVAVAGAGRNDNALARRESRRAEDCPACMQRALAADALVVVADPARECGACVLAAGHGGQAALSHRLGFGGEVFGMLTASVPAAYAGDAEEQGLFSELAGDLGFALHRLEATERLCASQRDLQHAQVLAHLGSWRLDLTSGQVAASAEARRIYGLQEREWTIAQVQAIPLPQYRGALDLALQRLVQDGAPYDLEFEIRRPTDQAVRHIHSRAEYDAVRHLVVGTIQDITEPTQATAALRHGHAMLARTERIANVGSWEWAVDGDQVHWSEELFRISQRDPAKGAPSFAEHAEFFVPEDVPKLGAAVERCLASGTPYELELRVVRPDGEIRHCIARGQTESAADGRVHQLVGSLQDITDRKRLEEELRQKSQRLEFVIEGSRLGTWEWNVQTNQTVFSATWAELVGYTLAELGPPTYTTWAALVHPSDVPVATERLRRCVSGDEPDYACEFRMRHQDGHWVWILARGRVMTRDPAGQPLLMFGTHMDITEHRALEDRLRQAQKMESVGRLAGGVAHDFNNLLMGIMNYVELCRDRLAADHPVREYLTEISSDAQRSANLTRQLLAFARKQTIAPEVLDLGDTVTGMLKMLRRLIGEDIEMAWMPAANLWPVKLDPGQVDQLLANLCVNARDAIGGVGKVTIETANAVLDEAYCARHAEATPGDYVMLAVSDDGCGMTPAILEHLFEPFFTTKGVGEGTGLGLATVHGIVKQNGGVINVYSEPGLGTTFRIYLPRCASADEAPAPTAPAPRPHGTESILLVEDEKSVRVTTALFLERLGYTVLSAAGPEEALSQAAALPAVIHLLITDVVMPGLSGRDLARRLLEQRPGLKCLFISGYTANVIAHRGVLDADVAFLAKPFGRDELAHKVRAVLSQHDGSP